MMLIQRSSEEVESSGWHDAEAHEQEPTGLETGIGIKNLTKIYEPVSIGMYMYSTCIFVHVGITQHHARAQTQILMNFSWDSNQHSSYTY